MPDEKKYKLGKPLSWYKPGKKIIVSDKMQHNYSYVLSARAGKDFDVGFLPQLTPAKMLQMGVFEGKYLNDCTMEFPREWYIQAINSNSLSFDKPDITCNEFEVKSRLSLQKWRSNGWIPIMPGDPDVRGWFQWYCRYWIGRRIPQLDAKQISRWRAFVRHSGQILASYKRLESPPITNKEKRHHRAKQRQALLQWSYNPYV